MRKMKKAGAVAGDPAKLGSSNLYARLIGGEKFPNIYTP